MMQEDEAYKKMLAREEKRKEKEEALKAEQALLD